MLGRGLRRIAIALTAVVLNGLHVPANAQGHPFSGGRPLAVDAVQHDGRPLALRGYLWEPAGPARGAVVLIHGSGGWNAHREGHYGQALSAAGFAVLAIDSFGPRGMADSTEDQARLPTLHMTKDAFAGLRLLVSIGHAPQRIAVMGFSKGGGVALHAADRNFLPEEVERFAVAVPVYPGCNVRLRTPRPVGRLFFALAEHDDYAGTAICRDIAEDYRRIGGDVTVKVYPGALHSFDNDPAIGSRTSLPRVQNFSRCVVFLEDDGAYTYDGKRYAPGDLSIYRDMGRTCMRRGATIGASAEQKAAFTADVIAYLTRALAP